MPFFLSIETSSDICSVAISNELGVIYSQTESESQTHAAKLTLLIDHSLKNCEISYHQLHAVFLSSGPGSYTGLRIGTSTAKGLCYGLKIPLVAVSALDILIAQVNNTNATLLCPMIDARRMEVYCKLLIKQASLEILPTHALIIEPDVFLNYLNENIVAFFGSGSPKAQALITHPNAIFIKDVKITAEALSTLGYQKWIKNEIEDTVHFEPHYVKDFQVKKSTKPLFPPVHK
ncbi:MAG: tRNA (adenosine(37)-N6)-threonylcarbamoyltransferase complex dimerization subunit type 1 TsaB [Cyclobacteriaceae bacterium]|jgi:tRNA threonylcarbamoyladenosine biosynthesis protein TsaB|nr:tRNA (adenosine(37)-N6)-threonylcarbamoyltransferase complex dimerization subunit type 1 TsaB [Cyclobacteriaceae bacterium]